MNKFVVTLVSSLISLPVIAIDHPGIAGDAHGAGTFPLIVDNAPARVVVAPDEAAGVRIAAGNLVTDFEKVARGGNPEGNRAVILVGEVGGPLIKQVIKNTPSVKWLADSLKGKREQYFITFAGDSMIVAGSDMRGTIYGIYEVSEQLGVSPWYDWADAPVARRGNVAVKRGNYTAGEPAVRYRGIFLNDEAPCLTSWVKNTYGTDYGDHRFYARVGELLLRLRGNFLWPAMWSWAFYADDPENSKTMSEMGIIMGTSHHEPMARNHQEWARRRKEYGAWNYNTNQKVIDRFFAEGIDRMKDTEDIVTIGMRGDGDEAMSEEADVKLMEKIVANQRKIITRHSGKKAKDVPQVWALYKEVLDYYDKGMRVPDDVTMLLCDDNWGNVRRLPDEKERRHPGGWGMYYHVDYVGAPRNSKWLNNTPIQNMWEQLQLTYDYGVDRLWILNVGDLKPMEYPITLFLDMAWNPRRFNVDNLLDHATGFCSQIFGGEQGPEAARILNLYCKYAGRSTAEMLDQSTFDLQSGEWRLVRDEFMTLETEALRQYLTIPDEARDAYKELILFPVQAMANLYDLYYSVAMNRALAADGNPQANEWAERARKCFDRDAMLMADYNNNIADGKWRGMMTQKHIGYTIWNDDFPADKMPETVTVEATGNGGYVATERDGVVSVEAEHFNACQGNSDASWTVIPYMGRTLSGVALMPYTVPIDGASLTYAVDVTTPVDSVTVHVITKSTLAFCNKAGHRYAVSIDGGSEQVVNFNHDLDERPENIYTVFYPTVARRVVEKSVTFPGLTPGRHIVTLRPLDPGIVFEKVVLDLGGFNPRSFLFMEESPVTLNK
ncbi:MAG: glycosyl hydrolase 115 family protein [Duncaniella sp.]|nr:glycosyl hydrolase 115 family protein [Duncaniella sp.]HBI59118.1 glycosyhydrolase [Porphyromonadaceae bacterium]